MPWVPACGGGVCPVSRPRVPAPARARGEARTPALGLRAMRAAPKGRKSLTEAHAWSFLQTVIWVPGDPRSLTLCPSSTSPTPVWPLVPSRGGRPTAAQDMGPPPPGLSARPQGVHHPPSFAPTPAPGTE